MKSRRFAYFGNPETIFLNLRELLPREMQVQYKCLRRRRDETDMAQFIFEDVFDHLNLIAPAGHYFGFQGVSYGFFAVPQGVQDEAGCLPWQHPGALCESGIYSERRSAL